MYEADLPLLRQLFRERPQQTGLAGTLEFWNSALSRHRIDRSKFRITFPICGALRKLSGSNMRAARFTVKNLPTTTIRCSGCPGSFRTPASW